MNTAAAPIRCPATPSSFSNFADNRLYMQRGDGDAHPFTNAGRQRFADFVPDSCRQRLIAVREEHSTTRRLHAQSNT